MQWSGLGPDETYPDRLAGCEEGVWEQSIEQQYTHYPRPQDGGNHVGSHYVILFNKQKHGLKVEDLSANGFIFQALPYSQLNLSQTTHDCDLSSDGSVYLNLDAALLGIGNSSCGPSVLKEHTIDASDLSKYKLHLRLWLF